MEPLEFDGWIDRPCWRGEVWCDEKMLCKTAERWKTREVSDILRYMQLNDDGPEYLEALAVLERHVPLPVVEDGSQLSLWDGEPPPSCLEDLQELMIAEGFDPQYVFSRDYNAAVILGGIEKKRRASIGGQDPRRLAMTTRCDVDEETTVNTEALATEEVMEQDELGRQDAVDDALTPNQRHIFKSLLNRKHAVEFDTLAEVERAWRKPSGEVSDDAIRKQIERMNEKLIDHHYSIDVSGRRAKLVDLKETTADNRADK